MDKFRELLSKNVKRLREARDLTQSDLAEAVDLSINMVQKIEHGHTNPSTETLARIAVALECSPSDLYFDAKSNQKSKTVAELTPEELVERLSKISSVKQLPDELSSAWREAEEWQRHFALFLLTGNEDHLKKVSPEARQRLEKGLQFFGMKPAKTRASKK